MQRVVKGRSATISYTFQVAGVATDPSPATATIEVLRADGTVLLSAGTATTRTGTGTFAYTLTPTHTALLDRLTVRWTATLAGYAQTHDTVVEVVGGFLFELAALRNHPDVIRSNKTYTDAQLVDARLWAEQRWETVCGYAFVPRYDRKRFSVSAPLRLAPYLRSIRSVTLNDEVIAAPHEFSAEGFLKVNRTARGSAVVGYEHGLDAPPYDVSDMALLIAKSKLVAGPITDRALQEWTDTGNTVAMATPGRSGSHFGIPEADAVADDYRLVVMA